MKIIDFILDFLFPVRCPRCHEFVSKSKMWHEKCLLETILIHSTKIESSLAISKYRGGTRELITDLKFNGRKSRIKVIEILLERAFESSNILQKFISKPNLIAVPIPLHPEREKLRGFNQADLIFRNWLKLHGVEMQCLLKRVVETAPSFKLSAEERMKNISGAFELEGDVNGKSILLVDDILTTGTTVMECSRILKLGGAKSIRILVLAADY